MLALTRRYPLQTYFGLAFAISWLGTAPLVASALGVLGSVPSWTHAFGAAGPVGAAIFVSFALHGREGPRSLLTRLRPSTLRGKWLLVATGTPFAIFFVAIVGVRMGTGVWPPWAGLGDVLGDATWLVDLAIASVAYGFGEEIGWRGFALPRLQTGRSALGATLILSVFWGLWHAPMFVYRFTWAGPVMIPGFFIGLFAGAIWFTFLLNSTGGSILGVALWHMCWNAVNLAGARISETVVATMSALVIGLAVVALASGGSSRLSRGAKYVERDGVAATAE